MSALLLVLLLALVGCSPTIVSLAPPATPPKAREYVDQLKRWTRHGQLQSDFEVALYVDATLMSPEFRAAYAEKVVTIYRMSQEEAATRRNAIVNEDPDFFTFHVESSAHNYQSSDLSSSKTIWRISVVNDMGRANAAAEIQASPNAREYDNALYPYGSTYSKPWVIRVPKKFPDGTPLIGPESRSLTLRFAGPPGSIDLIWQLR